MESPPETSPLRIRHVKAGRRYFWHDVFLLLLVGLWPWLQNLLWYSVSSILWSRVCVCVHVCTMHWGRRKKPCCGQAFLVDILEGEGFLEKRRKLLRHRAGLTDADRKKVGFPDSLGKFGSTNVLLEVGHMGCPLHEHIVIHGKLDLVAPPHKFTKSFSLWECVCFLCQGWPGVVLHHWIVVFVSA